MKRTVLLLGLLSVGYAYAQREGRMGINTTEPDATLHIVGKRINAQDKRAQGVIFPKLSTTERDQYTVGLKEGTMIYNTTLKCVDLYDGTKWSCITTMATSNSGNSNGNSTPSTGMQGVITGDVTLGGKTHYISSIRDNEYIPFIKPTQLATWEAGQTNGNDPMIDIPGIITTQGVDVKIPITITGNGGTVGAYRQEVAVAAEKSNNNQAGILILEWDAHQVTSNNKFITAKLKAKNTDFHIKQLDFSKGLGSDYKGLVLANFTYKKDNNNSTMEAFTVRAISGIPDKKLGVRTNGRLEHEFIYLPIQGPDGKTWLNNNLGAEYANINSQYFNPSHQAGARNANGSLLTNPTADEIKRDFRAFGYLYEWGRDSDGHEVITWNSHRNGHFQNSSLQNYNHNTAPKPGTAGDPCPSGFHTPTVYEQRALLTAIVGTNFPEDSYGNGSLHSSSLWNETVLRLPAAGSRLDFQSTIATQGTHGNYWSSTTRNTSSYYSNHIHFEDNMIYLNGDYWFYPTKGMSIRCIADH